jgi:hypothetical protein
MIAFKASLRQGWRRVAQLDHYIDALDAEIAAFVAADAVLAQIARQSRQWKSKSFILTGRPATCQRCRRPVQSRCHGQVSVDRYRKRLPQGIALLGLALLATLLFLNHIRHHPRDPERVAALRAS